jgi:hypothetical protein
MLSQHILQGTWFRILSCPLPLELAPSSLQPRGSSAGLTSFIGGAGHYDANEHWSAIVLPRGIAGDAIERVGLGSGSGLHRGGGGGGGGVARVEVGL